MKRMMFWAVLILLASACVRGAETETIEKLEKFMQVAADDGYVGSVIVKKGNEILLRGGYGLIDPDGSAKVAPDTVFTTGSITKQFTAAAILKLEEMGELSVSDPLTKYFDEVPEEKQGITIHHLLSHQAGFPGAIGDDRERVGRDEYVRRALRTPLLFEPGTAYEYSNVGFSLAAAIVEQVSGSDYERFIHDHLFEPAGMDDTGYVLPKWSQSRLAHGRNDDGSDWGTMRDRLLSDGGPGWHLVGNGGIQSTIDDMARWHDALQSSAILSEESKKKMYARHADEGGGTWYGYGWSIEPTPWGEMITHNGGNPYFFSDYLRFPEADVVIYYSNASRDRRHNRLARKLASIVFTGEMAELDPRPEAIVSTGSMDAPEGSVAAKWGFPGSYRGMRAAEYLEAIVNGDDAYRRTVVTDSMSPGIVERNGLDRLMVIFDQLRDELGEFEVRGVRPEGESGVAIVADRLDGSGMTITIILSLEPDEPHRIDGISVEAGN